MVSIRFVPVSLAQRRLDEAVADGRSFTERNFRTRYRDDVSDWIAYFLLRFDELRAEVDRNGWEIETWREFGEEYGVVRRPG